MHKASFVRIEGLRTPCLIVCQERDLPEELIIDFGEDATSSECGLSGQRTFRLQPTSMSQPEPIYSQVFDE